MKHLSTKSQTPRFLCDLYEHVREVLLDPKRFPSTASTLMRASPHDVERGRRVTERLPKRVPEPTLAGRDDPNHKQMRAMFNEAFKPSRVKQIDGRVESLAYELIDGFQEREDVIG